jgi:GT2 family glycosyltransferase
LNDQAFNTQFASDPAWPLVTVNILSCNRRDDLARTLTATLTELSYPRERLEVVVVDNASRDGSPEMVTSRFPSVTLVRGDRNIGVSAWNEGFRVGRGDLFLILDDDCYLIGDGLRRAVEAAIVYQADLVSWTVRSPWWECFTFNDLYNTGLLSFWGCSALVSRAAIDRLHGFDPNVFLWGHELDFTARFLDAGLRHLFLPDVNAIHLKRSLEQSPQAVALSTRSLAYVAAKLLQRTHAITALVNLGIKTVARSLTHPSRIRALAGLAAGARLGIQHRAPVRSSVSGLYRRNFIEFANPLLTTRGLGERIGRTQVRYRGFWEKRPSLYPEGRSSLRVNGAVATRERSPGGGSARAGASGSPA